MIVDKLKEFTAKFREEENNNDSLEILGGISDSNIEDMSVPCIPDDEIDEPTLLVYGPAPGYDDDFSICDHDDIDEPIPNVYGPDPGYDDKDLVTCVHDENDIIEKKDAQR